MTYQDKNTFWHNKPSLAGKPSSNNRFIYSAYSKYLAPNTLNMNKVLVEYVASTVSLSPVIIDRSYNDPMPPLSKDEVIGMVSLGLLTRNELEASYYNFCNIGLDKVEDRKLTFKSFFKAAKALFSIQGEHRNYFWENNVKDTYPLAFKLAPWDIYYVKKYYAAKTSILETMFFYLNIITTMRGDNKSTKMMLYLQLRDLNHPLLSILPVEDYILDYFGEDHPFYKNNFE